MGRVFEVEITDLNNDGRLDLLVTTNGANGTLLAYEIPDDFRYKMMTTLKRSLLSKHCSDLSLSENVTSRLSIWTLS